jgi:hypothetical protein
MNPMHHLNVTHTTTEAADTCVLCGQRSLRKSGLTLSVEKGGPVCRDCGKKHAPNLVALVDLAGTAQRVGRIGKHTLVPPLEALLDLARVAEEYNSTSSGTVGKAA